MWGLYNFITHAGTGLKIKRALLTTLSQQAQTRQSWKNRTYAIRDKYTNSRNRSLHKLLVLLHIVVQKINPFYLLLEKNMHSPLLRFPCRGIWVWLTLPASLPYLSPHSASGDEWLSNQWVNRRNWSQCLLLPFLEANLPAKGMMLVLFLPCSQGLSHGAAWRCHGPPMTKDISLSNSGGMSKQAPLPTNLEPFSNWLNKADFRSLFICFLILNF